MSQPSSQWQWVLNTTHLPIPHIMQWMVKWKTQYMGNSAHTHRMILTRGWPLTWKTPLTFITSRCLTESRLWVRKEICTLEVKYHLDDNIHILTHVKTSIKNKFIAKERSEIVWFQNMFYSYHVSATKYILLNDEWLFSDNKDIFYVVH